MNKSNNKRGQEEVFDTRASQYSLILLNDDVNEFDYVIQCLVKICGFDYERAEQCTLLAHLKGQYPILSGKKEVLESIQQQFHLKNIVTKIKEK